MRLLRNKFSNMKRGSVKKIVAVLSVAVIAVVMLITCPSKDVHCEAVSDEVTDAAMESLSASSAFGSLSPLAGILMPSIVESLVVTQLRVKNLFLFSVGYVNYDGKKNPVSVGVFGHVFVFGRDKIKRAIMGMADSFFDDKGRYDNLEKSEGPQLDEEGNVVR